MTLRSLFVVLAAAVALVSAAHADPAPLRTVASVDLARYGGLWHEAARLPNVFERGCVAATAQYTARPDGLIGVRNACRKGDGRSTGVDGRARVVDAASNAKLKVSFFGPFWGDYWIVDLAPDYSWAIVGEPRRRALWILTRAPRISPELRTDLAARVGAHGYDPAKLYWNPG